MNSLKIREFLKISQLLGILSRMESLNEEIEIEAAKSMLNEANLATQFWVEAVNIACFTQNRSLVVKRFKKTSYELFHGRKPFIGPLEVWSSANPWWFLVCFNFIGPNG